MLVLGIESSCDEAGVALYDSQKGLIDHIFYSQIEAHKPYGGVVPELASRDHIRKCAPLIEALLAKTGYTVADISGVAYTRGPGLSGALLVGAALARSLAFARGIPAVGIHHMEGHLLSPLLEQNQPTLPFVALLVSGGHTLLVKVAALGRYEILGSSLDDAAGEAFDKTARLMGLEYPGGPALARLAERGNPKAFPLPRPLLNREDLHFSFSGLKTAVANLLMKHPRILTEAKADLAASFEAAVVDVLVGKSLQALKKTGLKQLVLAGGVSANQKLRLQLDAALRQQGGRVLYPRLEFCTDNGAMIAFAGCLRLQAGQQDALDFSVKARWSLEALEAIPNMSKIDITTIIE